MTTPNDIPTFAFDADLHQSSRPPYFLRAAGCEEPVVTATGTQPANLVGRSETHLCSAEAAESLGAGIHRDAVDAFTKLRAAATEAGFDLTIYSNELAVIHTVLKRLNEAGEIRIVPGAGAKNAYLWVKPPRAIALGPEVAQFIRGGTSR